MYFLATVRVFFNFAHSELEQLVFPFPLYCFACCDKFFILRVATNRWDRTRKPNKHKSVVHISWNYKLSSYTESQVNTGTGWEGNRDAARYSGSIQIHLNYIISWRRFSHRVCSKTPNALEAKRPKKIYSVLQFITKQSFSSMQFHLHELLKVDWWLAMLHGNYPTVLNKHDNTLYSKSILTDKFSKRK